MSQVATEADGISRAKAIVKRWQQEFTGLESLDHDGTHSLVAAWVEQATQSLVEQLLQAARRAKENDDQD